MSKILISWTLNRYSLSYVYDMGSLDYKQAHFLAHSGRGTQTPLYFMAHPGLVWPRQQYSWAGQLDDKMATVCCKKGGYAKNCSFMDLAHGQTMLWDMNVLLWEHTINIMT